MPGSRELATSEWPLRLCRSADAPPERGAAHTTEHLAEKLGGPKWQRELKRMIEKGEKKGKMVVVG